MSPRIYHGRRRGVSHRHVRPAQVARIIDEEWTRGITRFDGKLVTDAILDALSNGEYYGRVPIDQETGDLADYIIAHHSRERFESNPTLKIHLDTDAVRFTLPDDFVEKYPIVPWTQYEDDAGRVRFEAPSIEDRERVTVTEPVLEALLDANALAEPIDVTEDWFLPVSTEDCLVQALVSPTHESLAEAVSIDTTAAVIGDEWLPLSEYKTEQQATEVVSRDDYPFYIDRFISACESNEVSWEPMETITTLRVQNEVVKVVAPEETGAAVSVGAEVDVLVCYFNTTVAGVEESHFSVVRNPDSTVFPQAILAGIMDSMSVSKFFE